MRFYKEKDLARCGLACVLCHQQDCPGCKASGCERESSCTVLRCVTEKGLDGCYQCDDFPCDENMLKGARKLAFNRYARRFGKEALLQRLQTNALKGIIYHRPDEIYGDYDLPETEEEVLRLLHFGVSDPYIRCPVIETAHFTLRLVRLEDAEPLLRCYGDPEAQALFNADNCTSDFRFQTVTEMREYIEIWLGEYQRRAYIRLAVVDKAQGVPVGTFEMFGSKNKSGVLRLDLAAVYEKRKYLRELLGQCVRDFYLLFQVRQMRTKVPVLAKERAAVCKALGFQPQRDTNYWSREDGNIPS